MLYQIKIKIPIFISNLTVFKEEVKNLFKTVFEALKAFYILLIIKKKRHCDNFDICHLRPSYYIEIDSSNKIFHGVYQDCQKQYT